MPTWCRGSDIAASAITATFCWAPQRLQGGTINDWYAPNITGSSLDGVGSWSQQALETFLKTGATPTGSTALDPMAETIRNSLQYLTDGDRAAIAAYLKSTAGKPSYAENKGGVSEAGAALYLSNCAFCHEQSGRGVAGEIPALAGSGVVRARGAEDALRVVLGGLPATRTLAPMPAVGAGMSDEQIAAVVNYVRSAWGNNAPTDAAPGQVARLRTETHTLLAVNGGEGCADGAQLAAADAIPRHRPSSQRNYRRQFDTECGRAHSEREAGGAEGHPGRSRQRPYQSLLSSVAADESLTEAQRAARLVTFADTVYRQLTRGSARN
jgi:mono/diheme cytochrome c family protein